MKAKTGDDTTEKIYTDWYKSVCLPTAAAEAASDVSEQSTKSTAKVVKE